MEGQEGETPSLQSEKNDKHRNRESRSGGTSESWVVAIAASLLHTLTSLGAATTGVYMVELVDYFNTGKAEVSWIGAIQLSLGGLGCLIIGGLVGRIGSPRTALLGTLLVSGGHIAASFCNTIPALCVTLGAIVGLGGSCWIISCMVAVQSYYVKRRSLATSVMTIGTSIGHAALPIWTEYFIRVFNWRGALLVNAAVALHGIPLAMLLRQGMKCKSPRKNATTEQQNIKDTDSNGQVLFNNGTPVRSPSVIKSQNEQAPLNPTGRDFIPVPADDNGDNNVSQPSIEQEDNLDRRGNSIHFKELDQSVVESDPMENARSETEECTEQVEEAKKGCSRSIYSELFHMPEVVLYILAAGCINYGHVVATTFLPTRAVSLGISRELAATLVSIIGIVGPVGRLGSGYLGDVFSKHRQIMYTLSGILSGTASILSALAFNYASLVVYSISFALLSGCYVSFLSTLMTDLAGVKRLPQALGLLLPFVGTLVLVSVTTSGMLVDATKNTAVAFIYCGGFQILGGIISGIIVIIQRRRRDRQVPPEQTLTVT